MEVGKVLEMLSRVFAPAAKPPATVTSLKAGRMGVVPFFDKYKLTFKSLAAIVPEFSAL